MIGWLSRGTFPGNPFRETFRGNVATDNVEKRYQVLLAVFSWFPTKLMEEYSGKGSRECPPRDVPPFDQCFVSVHPFTQSPQQDWFFIPMVISYNKSGNLIINQNPCVSHWFSHVFYCKVFRVIVRFCTWWTLQKDKVSPWFPRHPQLWRTGSGLRQCRPATNLPEIAKVT